MKRILAYILITTAVLSLGVLIARRIGAAQPPSSFAMLFTNPDGTPCQMPCMLGSRVGETTEEQAYSLLQAHPLARRVTRFPDQSNDATLSDIVTVDLMFSEEKKVAGIMISCQLYQPLADAIAQLRQPDGIDLDEISSHSRLLYYTDNIVIFFRQDLRCDANGQCSTDGFSLETGIMAMIIGGAKSWMESDYSVMKWVGFASMTCYFAPTPQP
jgi:hypothetical protein